MSIEETRNTRIAMNMTEKLNCVLLWGGNVSADAIEFACAKQSVNNYSESNLDFKVLFSRKFMLWHTDKI